MVKDSMVEIMGADPGTSFMRYIQDPVSGEYLFPLQSQGEQAFQYRVMRASVKASFLEQEGAREEDFEAFWEVRWKELLAKRGKEDLTVPPVAFVDTGIISDHPLLKGCIIKQYDLTEEGPYGQDINGHGTMMALEFRAGSFHKPRIINVKVAGSDGRGSRDDLIAGIEWLINYQKESQFNGPILNISLGIYPNKWSLAPCRGTCPLCRVTIEAARHGFRVFAAAGNKHGVTSCPARAALFNKDDDLWLHAVAAGGFSESGIGTISTPGGTGRTVFVSSDILKSLMNEFSSTE